MSGQVALMTPAMLAQIERLEQSIVATFGNQADELPVKHYFSKGVYARELFIPKGTVITGKVHKFENLNIMSQGDLSVLMEDGTIKRVRAPFTIVSPPGTKRVAYAHADTVWTTIHGTDETDVDRIEAHFIAQDYGAYLRFVELMKLEG